MTTLRTAEPQEIHTTRQHIKLVDFLGSEHPIPVNPTADAKVLVTASRDKSQIGQVLPFKVQEGDDTVRLVSGDYIVSGPVSDPGNNNQVRDSTLSGAKVAFPYEDGWLHGSVTAVLPDRAGYKVAVNGGVGVAQPVNLTRRVGGPRWEVTVSHIFKLPVYLHLPLLTDPFETASAKLTSTRMYLKAMRIQGQLMRAMMEEDKVDEVDSLPRFIYKNSWHYSARVVLADVTHIKVLNPSLPHPTITRASASHRTVEAVRFEPEVPTFMVKAQTHDEAIDAGEKALQAWVSQQFTDSTVILSRIESELFYAGVVR